MKKITLVRMIINKDQDLQRQGREGISADLEELSAAQAYRPAFLDIYEMATATLPIIPVVHREQVAFPQETKPADTASENRVTLLRKLLTSSGIYGLSAAASPLISLVLTPFLAHNLSTTDYGVLAIINTVIGLMTGITQFGLSSAFFRAYNYDYSTERDHKGVLATTTLLLCLISIPFTLLIILLAPQLAQLLCGNSKYAIDISLASGVVLIQNLTIPGLSWQRAEDHPLFYSLLSLSNLLGTLFATLLFVGVLNGGTAGAIIANGLGYACIVICTLPIIFIRKGIKMRFDIARSMLAFGGPLVLNFVSYWILQLSDRYLLGLFTSLTQTAKYTVAYTLGSVMAPLIISPFTLAWPTAMFTIAKRDDASEVFRLVFRWLSLFLLLCAFGLSIAGIFLLDHLFPHAYYSAAPVIPIVTLSIVFYGIYYIFTVGVNVKRKTWLISLYTTVAAVLNVALNLVLIPHYGIIGAATSTLLAYIALAAVTYIVNQKMYPISFEIGRFILALALGIALYAGSGFLANMVGAGKNLTLGISLCLLCLYGGCLIFFLKLPLATVKKVVFRKIGER